MSNFKPDSFWNTFKFGPNSIGFWKYGPLSLWLKRRDNEWKIWWQYSSDPLDLNFQHSLPFTGSTPGRDKICEKRFGLKKTEDEIILSPTLPNRALVTRPDPSFYLLPHEEISLFISVPLWVKIETASHKILDEVPVYHLSETWFGDPAGEGELCYYTKTSAKLRLEELPERFHRAIIAVYIKNSGKTNLFLERIKIPITNLSLFQNRENLFFTQSMVLERERDGSFAHLRLNPRPHPEVGEVREVYPPRNPLKENIIIKTLNHFL